MRMRIRDLFDPGSGIRFGKFGSRIRFGKIGSRIRDKHPVSATLIIWICPNGRSTTRTTSTRGRRCSSGRRCTLRSAGPPSSKVLAGKPRSSRLVQESGIRICIKFTEWIRIRSMRIRIHQLNLHSNFSNVLKQVI
jgi:hypothetical protein